MNRKNRIRSMVFVLAILMGCAIDRFFFGNWSPVLDLIVGFCAGWALRETLEPMGAKE